MNTQQMELPGVQAGHRSGVCGRCGRPLKNPKSVERGYGAVCAAKLGIHSGEKEQNVSDTQDVYIDEPLEKGIILERRADGTLATNVPHLVTHHSPTGYEWGYGGSGPADLALNIVENILRRMNYDGALTEPLWDGYRVFQAAYRMHQSFKFTFIGAAPRDRGRYSLDYAEARSWVESWLSSNQD